MFDKRERVKSILQDAVVEMKFLIKAIPWKSVFGMRNFLSHEYGDVDAEGVFNTVKSNIPELLRVARNMQEDLEAGQLDRFL